MSNKKMMGCALALGFLALAACSPSNPGESSSAAPAVSDNTNVSASEVVSEIVSENVSVAPIAGEYTFNVSAAYGSAYVFGEGELLGGWPGTALTVLDESWKTITITVTDAANDHIIFNSKNGNEQTVNLEFPKEPGTYYFVNETKGDNWNGEFVKNVFEISGKNKALVGGTRELKLAKIGVEGAVTWASDDTNVASVKADATDELKATWTAVGAGTANITAKAGDVTATFQVTVEAPEAEGDISLWVPTVDTTFINEKVIPAFKTAHPEFTGKVTIKANFGEGDVRTELAKDLDTAADVMCMADDNITSAAQSELLASVTAEDKNSIATTDGADGVKAGEYGDTLYGYPYRADNGYILFYNKALFPNPADVESMESLLAKAAEKNTKVYWDLSQGWYAPAPFWANGVTFGLDQDGNMLGEDFASEKAVKAGMALMEQYKQYGGTTLVYSADTGVLEAGFKDQSVGACILWNNYAAFHSALGDNLGYTVLPTMNINGEDKPLHTFNGYKFMSVKAGLSDTKKALCQEFCRFATSPEMQYLRAAELGQGPSNVTVAADEEVKALPFVGQIAQMVSEGRTHAQAANVNAKFWDPMASIGSTIMDGASTDTWSTYGKGEEGARAFFQSIAEAISVKIA